MTVRSDLTDLVSTSFGQRRQKTSTTSPVLGNDAHAAHEPTVQMGKIWSSGVVWDGPKTTGSVLWEGGTKRFEVKAETGFTVGSHVMTQSEMIAAARLFISKCATWESTVTNH